MASYFTTTRDIVIPAGSQFHTPPTHSSRWGKDYEIIVGVGADFSGYFSMDLQAARESGLLREEQPQLGLATTRELMEELVARGVLGAPLIDDLPESTLNYRTVDAQ